MIGVAILFIFICFMLLPFMNRMDKKREARVAAFKKRLAGIGKSDAEEAAKARLER